jgi:hypothetical protein
MAELVSTIAAPVSESPDRFRQIGGARFLGAPEHQERSRSPHSRASFGSGKVPSWQAVSNRRSGVRRIRSIRPPGESAIQRIERQRALDRFRGRALAPDARTELRI